jgi:hypothetical protein
MLATKVGLVDMTGEVDSQTMAAVAAAINVQVTRDLPQYWSVNATVSYLTDPKKSRRAYGRFSSSSPCRQAKEASI